MALRNQIAQFQFDQMEGTPTAPYQHIEVLPPRLGVDGTAFRRAGTRGDPFELRTSVAVANTFTAHSVTNLHDDLTNFDPIDLWQDSVQLSGRFRFKVLRVVPVNMRKLALIVGAVLLSNGSAGVWLQEVWTLQAVDTAQNN